MKFKVGDNVRVTKDWAGEAKTGMVGTVRRIVDYGPDRIGVDFGENATTEMHTLEGTLMSDTGWYIPEDHLELIPRPIKQGSKWRISRVGVTVKAVDDTVLAEFDGHETEKIEVSADAWRQIATWVSDPVETPKVGSWVEDVDGPRVVVVKNEKSNPFCAIPQYLLHPDKVGNEYKPCEPPPLVKALDRLADTHPGDEFEWRHVQAVMTEWRAIKAKMGVE